MISLLQPHLDAAGSSTPVLSVLSYPDSYINPTIVPVPQTTKHRNFQPQRSKIILPVSYYLYVESVEILADWRTFKRITDLNHLGGELGAVPGLSAHPTTRQLLESNITWRRIMWCVYPKTRLTAGIQYFGLTFPSASTCDGRVFCDCSFSEIKV
jgi:hypothetical protein